MSRRDRAAYRYRMDGVGVKRQDTVVLAQHYSVKTRIVLELRVFGRRNHCAQVSSRGIIENAELEHGHKNTADHIVQLRQANGGGLNSGLEGIAKPGCVRHFQIQTLVDGYFHVEIGAPITIDKAAEAKHGFAFRAK